MAEEPSKMPTSQSAADGLRQRNAPIRANTSEEARQAVLDLNAAEENSDKPEKDRKTFGRTPDVFTVPFTHDMVSQLLSPSEPKNFGDILVLLILALHILLVWALPPGYREPTIGAIFLIWRAGYNIGIGYLLHMQSHHKMLVRWARRLKLFPSASNGQNPHPTVRAFIKRELETKIPKDYDFDAAPIEYNTWLVFRRIVDLILMCDFSSYMLFAISCGHRPVGEYMFMTVFRWVVGLSLFAFNLWVKLDAHRVVKDFAWYWGDFFFLIDQELTFDGVFEMAPHPMYSIGYVGYYGISLMAASYKVLFISIIAHAAQFAFLVLVESPHIERTYSSPPPRRSINELPLAAHAEKALAETTTTADIWPHPAHAQPSQTHNLLGLNNIDLYRTTDWAVLVLQVYIFSLTVLTPNTSLYQAFFVINALIWRLWFSAGIGYMLNRQSAKKKWTRHFLKYGESTGEAWRQWKGVYHLSMILCYAWFAAAAWKMYTLPADWNYGLALLRHVIGFGLIALQVWVSFSIYDQLGEFGWFFGDFFFDHSPKLTYGGIYRFLNNPERVLGLAGVWGVALITCSRAIFCLALLSHTLSLAFIHLVERPHMQKLYGRSLRQDAGLVRSLRRSLPPPLRQWQDGMDKMLTESFDYLEDFFDDVSPKLAAGVTSIVQDTKNLIPKTPSRMSFSRFEPELARLNPKDYRLEIEGTPASPTADSQRLSERESQAGTRPAEATNGHKALVFEYGAPVKVKWTAPLNHGKQDWVGLYMVTDNAHRDITKLSSAGRWVATNPGEFNLLDSEVGLISSDVKKTIKDGDGVEKEYVTGEMVFSGDKLFWTQGTFEFRYHHNGNHNVMAISLPFEIRIPRFSEDELEGPEGDNLGTASPQNDTMIRHSIEKTLLPIVQNCFDRDPNIAPSTPSEAFGSLVERDGKYAKRVVYAIHQMFGIEFAPQVVKADGRVENLAWRIWEAKKVLAPFSMSRSRGTSTPVEESI
ncbi:phosphatidylethanolamine N-methyltransferase [Elasticomyces elasticus]|uniref:Phosphatidylethanolamine N-methyltransferase n=1 Tax=Exophiala sideris TaxID=1016849 RepID=A0ABR0JK23_9EURO|nr:phosphatidylethanolamine N-methyltransferase [Elasticomyces elasticus]KAK5034218.1 phosphatidylethanolamine N-methyltransferase [Exophiala sideris]KAK5042514.1 phosphatidylethanolamine N-methyltransferase [Exophiala sideris]KAK5065596.1 phosphatidylethanolamine N-methyltransferase [Exophiala sideris]KAK5185946.1 phosphatidylethanolamine N-methyltransferase [Eurotiomycetes sp. CCFEE 6388]